MFIAYYLLVRMSYECAERRVSFFATWVKLEGFDTKVEKGKGVGVAFYPIILGCFI
jgi:hypothetical protein